jgi:type I restriction enzyme S subunit
MNSQIKLTTIADIITGFPFKGDQYSDNGIRTVRGENVTEGRLRWDTIKCWNQEFDKENDYLLKANDVVIGMDGSKVGKNKARIKEIDLPLLLAQRVACVRAKKKNDQVFLYYLINNPRFEEYVFKTQTGSSVPHISKSQIEDYVVPDIRYEEQQKIAAVLSVLDDKIALNNRINAELEAMAKTLYDYWFVQFDFPFDFTSASLSNNAQGKPSAEGKPYKSSGGKMVWCEELKREIPEEWDVGELKDIANITMGQSPAGESYNEDGNGMVFYQGCTDFGTRFPTIRKYTTEPTRFARQGDILLSVRAPVGTLNIAKENCCIGRGLAALNSKDNCIAYLFGVMVNLKQIFDRRNTDGTTFGSITKDDLFTLKVIKPSNEVLEMYHKLINPCFEKQNLVAEENQQLSSLRDWLLPMLMNGQVSVGEAVPEFETLIAAEPGVKYGKSNKVSS